MLENIVYNELMYQGFTVNVGTFESIEKNSEGRSVRKTNEIDFLAEKGQRYYDIQVTADLSDARTRERELRPFFLLNDQAEKILIHITRVFFTPLCYGDGQLYEFAKE